MARFFLSLGLAALALAVFATPLHAARLLHLTVSRDGAVVLDLIYSDDGTGRSGDVWRSVGGEPGGVELAAGFDPDAPEGLTATLTGDIEAVVRHSRDPLFTVRVNQLRLVRSSATSNDWHIPSDEIERIALLNGIPPAATLRALDPLQMVLVGFLVLCAMLAMAIVSWLLLRRKPEPAE